MSVSAGAEIATFLLKDFGFDCIFSSFERVRKIHPSRTEEQQSRGGIKALSSKYYSMGSLLWML